MSAARPLRAGTLLALALACAGGGACAFLAPFPDVAPDPDGAGDGCAPGVTAHCAGAFLWGEAFGDEGDQRGSALAVGDGVVVLAGRATGGIDLGDGATTELGAAGKPDCFLASFDAAGQIRWSRRFADSDGRGVAVASGGDVVLVGGTSGPVDFGGGVLTGIGVNEDLFIARFDASGAHRWSRRFGNGASQTAAAVAVDAAGNSLVTGTFWGKLDFGAVVVESAGESDVFVAKLDAEGEIVWARSFGDAANHQVGSGVAIDNNNGDVVLTGWFKGSVTFGGLPLHSAGETDLFVAKLSPAGDHLWSRTFPSTGAGRALGVAVDGAGNIFTAGSFRSSISIGQETHYTSGDKDIVLAKLTDEGAPLWSRSYGDAGDQEAVSVAVHPAGEVVVTGSFLGKVDLGAGALTATGGADGFIARLDPGGAPLWARSFGDSSEQGGLAVAADALGNTWATGYFDGAADFGGGLTQASGASDAFLIQLGP